MRLATTVDAHRNGIKGVQESCAEFNRHKRIRKALGSGNRIPRVHEDLLPGYYKYLMEQLRFPFLAHFPKPATPQEEEDFRCTVLGLLDPAQHLGDGFDGIFTVICKGKYELHLPLIDLYLPEDCGSFQLIDDYWYWFWNWR